MNKQYYQNLNKKSAKRPKTSLSDPHCLPVGLQDALPVRKQTGETQEQLDQADMISEVADKAWLTSQGCF